MLVTGATGSGKSTTLAAMIDRINSTGRCKAALTIAATGHVVFATLHTNDRPAMAAAASRRPAGRPAPVWAATPTAWEAQ